jgi:hypothetical protein
MNSLGLDFASLREKSRVLLDEMGGQVSSDQLVLLDQSAFMEKWRRYYRHRAENGRWYQTLYRDFIRGKAVLEIGSGLGFDGIFFLEEGAKQWTFCDIAKANLHVVGRVCEQLGVHGDLIFIDDNFDCFDKLGMYDVVWVYGSLINVPFEFAQAECRKILPHLKPRGRWIEACFPPERWQRWVKPPVSEWTMPWIELYDIGKMKKRLFPAPMEVVLDFNFSEHQFKWLDLAFASDDLFNPEHSVVDFAVLPLAPAVELHGDAVLVGSADKSVDITTPEPTWSYAASVNLAATIGQTENKSRKFKDGFTVEIELIVSQGHVGILLVGDDISTPLCGEYMVAPSSCSITVMISVLPQIGGRRLIFRNTAARTRSQFKLESIKLKYVTKE